MSEHIDALVKNFIYHIPTFMDSLDNLGKDPEWKKLSGKEKQKLITTAGARKRNDEVYEGVYQEPIKASEKRCSIKETLEDYALWWYAHEGYIPRDSLNNPIWFYEERVHGKIKDSAYYHPDFIKERENDIARIVAGTYPRDPFSGEPFNGSIAEHHIDGNKHNNDPMNLIPMNTTSHNQLTFETSLWTSNGSRSRRIFWGNKFTEINTVIKGGNY